MLKILDETQNNVLPTLTIDEYIPLKVRWVDGGGTIVHWRIENTQTLVDFAIDRYFGLIEYIVCPILQCSTEPSEKACFEHFPSSIEPSLGCPKILMDNLEHVEVTAQAPKNVKLEVYFIGRKIYFLFGNQPATQLVKSGFVTFGISEENKLCGFITELTDSECQSLKEFHNVEADP